MGNVLVVGGALGGLLGGLVGLVFFAILPEICTQQAGVLDLQTGVLDLQRCMDDVV